MEKETGRKAMEARERDKKKDKEARGQGKGNDPLRDSPIDKSDVGRDLSPAGAGIRRDPEGIKHARQQRLKEKLAENDKKIKGIEKKVGGMKERSQERQEKGKEEGKGKGKERGKERDDRTARNDRDGRDR